MPKVQSSRTQRIVEARAWKSTKKTYLSAKTYTLNALTLPNPYGSIRSKQLENSSEKIEEWICAQSVSARTRFDNLVKKGCTMIDGGYDVRVECKGGKHRSVAVAMAISRHFDPPLVVHTPELN